MTASYNIQITTSMNMQEKQRWHFGQKLAPTVIKIQTGRSITLI